MWMTQFIQEVKRQLRDVYGLKPSRMVGDEPCFDDVKDGLYEMEIEGKTEYVAIIGQKIHVLEKMESKR